MARCKTKEWGNPKGQGGNTPLTRKKKTWVDGMSTSPPDVTLVRRQLSEPGDESRATTLIRALGRWSARYREPARAGGVVRVPLFLPDASMCAKPYSHNLARDLTIP